jgi:rod shape-determining protein MreD
MSISTYLAIPLMVIVAILQATVLPRFPLLGVEPQLALLMTVAWSLLRGVREGLLWAFLLGLAVDIFSAGPMGVTTLSLMAAVGMAIFIQRSFPESRVLLPVALAAVTTGVFWFVNVLVLRLVMPMMIRQAAALGILDLARGIQAPGLLGEIGANYGLSGPTLQLIAGSAAVHCLLILPVYWAFRYVDGFIRPRRVEV